MDSQSSIQPEQLIGVTDRGELWRATRQRRGDRIVRILDPRFCDEDFRLSVRSLREKPLPRMLQIVDEGWVGNRFYVEYRVDSVWETLDEHFTRLHWRLRLALVDQICDVLPQWSNCPVRPLGLNGQNIMMVKDAGRWFPWLLPCPPLKYSSPCDLFGLDSSVVSALAPEIIRDVHSDKRAQDSYALGNLAIRALGCKESQRAITDGDRIEAQACSALLVCDISLSEVDSSLRSVEEIKSLIQVIRRHTQIVPVARPISASELRAACAGAFAATDPLTLASDLIKRGNLHEALERLEWGFECFGESFEGRLLAAEICEQSGDIPLALKHLDRAFTLAPSNLDLLWRLRQRRCGLRWLLYQTLQPLTAGEPDPEGDLLLADLTFLKGMPEHSTQRNEFYIRTAMVYRRRQDLEMAAQELYEAAELEPADLKALFLYGECMRDLGDHEAATQIVQIARDRISKMTLNQMMVDTEAQKWREKFAALL